MAYPGRSSSNGSGGTSLPSSRSLASAAIVSCSHHTVVPETNIRQTRCGSAET